MNKLPQKGEFNFNKEPNIVDVWWKDEHLKTDIGYADLKDKVSIMAMTRNMDAGEKVVIHVEEENEEDVIKGQKRIKYEGVVNDEGLVELKACLEIEDHNKN